MSNSVYGTLSQWARRTSSWAESRFFSLGADPSPSEDGFIYRLRHWPDLPASLRKAGVYRVLSVMSQRPVNRPWLAGHAGLPAAQLDRLLRTLQHQDAVEVTDSRQFTPSMSPPHPEQITAKSSPHGPEQARQVQTVR